VPSVAALSSPPISGTGTDALTGADPKRLPPRLPLTIANEEEVARAGAGIGSGSGVDTSAGEGGALNAFADLDFFTNFRRWPAEAQADDEHPS
jgi:hypothetical protein